MPLNITSTGPSGVSVLNKWANQRETDLQSHKKLIGSLQNYIKEIFKHNPDLKDPRA